MLDICRRCKYLPENELKQLCERICDILISESNVQPVRLSDTKPDCGIPQNRQKLNNFGLKIEQNRRLYTALCGIQIIGKTHPTVVEEKWLLGYERFGDIENLLSLVGFRTGVGIFITKSHPISGISKSFFLH